MIGSARPWLRRVLAVSAGGLLATAAARSPAAEPHSAKLEPAAGVLPVPATSRSSASYTIVGDAVDSGGGGVRFSAAYSMSGSAVGQTATTSPAAPVQASAAYALKSGFVGQLYDVRGLGLVGAPVPVNEGATVQLTPAPLLDDGTLLAALPPGSVTWSVVSGPLPSVTTAGVATAGTVYQNTGATVRMASASLSGTGALSVVNVNIDDYGSYAGDGIDDAWQVQYFGFNNPQAGPNVDADGTGQTNLFKYLAGLNPLDPASRFALTISAVPGQPGQKVLSFLPRYDGRTYTLQTTTSLQQPNWTTVTSITTSDNGNTRTITDLNAGTAPRFYRVQISFP